MICPIFLPFIRASSALKRIDQHGRQRYWLQLFCKMYTCNFSRYSHEAALDGGPDLSYRNGKVVISIRMLFRKIIWHPIELISVDHSSTTNRSLVTTVYQHCDILLFRVSSSLIISIAIGIWHPNEKTTLSMELLVRSVMQHVLVRGIRYLINGFVQSILFDSD